MLAWRARDIVRDNEMSMERRESGAGMRISFGLRELRGTTSHFLLLNYFTGL